LNAADGSYLNEFRIHEGVDTSYTTFNRKPDPIDDHPFDKIVPPADLPYLEGHSLAGLDRSIGRDMRAGQKSKHIFVARSDRKKKLAASSESAAVAFDTTIWRKPLAVAADAGFPMEFQSMFAWKALPEADLAKRQLLMLSDPNMKLSPSG
jgi:hypothetical protein